MFTGILLLCADERSVIYFLLCISFLKLPLRLACIVLVLASSITDVTIVILLASLLTFLISFSLSTTFAMVYLLSSGFTAMLLVLFKSTAAVLQINFVMTLCFAASQYIFVTVFSPSSVLSLVVQLPTKLLMLILIFLNSTAAVSSLISLLFVVLTTFTTSSRILLLLGSVAQTPSLLNLFFDAPDITVLNFMWYGAMLITIFIMFESGITTLLGYCTIIGLPLTLPLLLKFIVMVSTDSLVATAVIVPLILSGIVLGSWSLTSWLQHSSG